MDKLVEFIAKSLVDHPEAVRVTTREEDDSVVIELVVDPEDTGKVIGGGPMMGKALLNTDVPVCKGSSGILLMTEKESVRGEEQPCIRCSKCVTACPMGLEPYLLQKLAEHSDWERAEAEQIMTCIECGSCQFTCPAHRPLLDWIRLAKGTVGGIIRARAAKK